MAPTLHRRANPAQLKTWLIVIAVVASVIVTALIVYLVVFRLRNKQYQEAAKRDPYLTRKEWARRRKLSNLQRLEEEEVQRQLILRKTLTSRTSSRNDSEIFEIRRDAGSAEEPRKEAAEKRREEEWKKWEAGYGADVENDACEGHPLIEQHPAVKGVEDQLPRSISPTRAPLLPMQEPESGRASLWERRLSDLHTPSLRKPSTSPPRAPPSSSPAPESLIEHPHIFAHPAHHLLHNSSTRQARSVSDFQRQSPSQRSRAASADARHDPKLRSTSSSFHSRASSNPVKHAPPQIPTSARARSNSTSPTPSTSLVSPPPPAALPHSASPRNDGFLDREPEQPQIQTRRDRPLSLPRAPVQTTHTRTRSHEMLPFFRNSSPSPSQSPRRKPVPNRALSGKLSLSSLAGGTRAAGVSPAVSPVEEATLESERTPVSPGATLIPDGPPAVVREKEGLERMAASDRDILPSQVQQTLQLDPIPSPPQPNNTSSGEDSQPSSFEGGAFFEGPKISLNNLPSQPERRSSSPRGSSGLAPPEQQPDYLDAGNHDQVGTAFSFEVGDQLKELGISVRRLPERTSSPPTVASEPPQQEYEIDTEDEEIGSTFSFEEGDQLKELEVSIRDPATQQPSVSPEPPSLQQSARYTDTEKQEEGAAFSFEEDSQLKEMGLSLRDPPPRKRRNSPLTQLEIPRLTKDRSRSFEDRNVSQPGLELTPDVIAHRLRSRSFEPVAQGKWELQVSVLDQTGARHSRTSKEGGDSDYYSSASEPASPEDENTFDAEIPLAPFAKSSRPFVAPVGVRGAPNPPSAKSSPTMAHNRTPSTPLTSPDSDASGLCRANFASPIKEKQLAEEQSSPRSPPANRPLFHSASPVSPPMQSPPTFVSPHTVVYPHTEAGWTVASPQGWRDRRTMEMEYGRDTMKEIWGSGPQAPAPDTEKSKVSFRLSGPPDFMPAFL